jgi:hypothetical protein
MVTGPTRRGRQCNTHTCTIHSNNGNAASITTGVSASDRRQSPTTIRAVSAATSSVPIIHGDGCRQNAMAAPPRDVERRRDSAASSARTRSRAR